MDILVIGAGGLAREFASYFCDGSSGLRVVGFSTLAHAEREAFDRDERLFFGDDITPDEAGTTQAVVAVSNPAVKARLHRSLQQRGFTLPRFIHPSSVVSSRAELAEGVVVGPNCVVSPGVRVGALAYLNFCVGVGHDARIGTYAQLNPGVQVGGGSIIGECTLVGSGAVILQELEVGERATIASGAVVFSRVAAGATMLGNPARRMRALENRTD